MGMAPQNGVPTNPQKYYVYIYIYNLYNIYYLIHKVIYIYTYYPVSLFNIYISENTLKRSANHSPANPATPSEGSPSLGTSPKLTGTEAFARRSKSLALEPDQVVSGKMRKCCEPAWLEAWFQKVNMPNMNRKLTSYIYIVYIYSVYMYTYSIYIHTVYIYMF